MRLWWTVERVRSLPAMWILRGEEKLNKQLLDAAALLERAENKHAKLQEACAAITENLPSTQTLCT